MNYGIITLVICLVILHVSIAIFTWMEKRYMPLLQKITDRETLTMKLNKIGEQYQKIGIEVPQEFLQCPSLIVREAKRMELRLSIEVILVSLAGIIPPGVLVVVFG